MANQRKSRWHDAADKWLRLIAIALLVLLVLSQIGLRSDSFRHWVTEVERLEGTPIR
ncbi:hypothetical protein [Paenibacillus beijingensis]|uniref:hypothetical protein n=1 Tax=Paenibacillus beijingensis TaxID=1126833 RepID=UPI00130DA2EF|nr:hypothetical protein [Paenibacillus beijingensis]